MRSSRKHVVDDMCVLTYMYMSRRGSLQSDQSSSGDADASSPGTKCMPGAVLRPMLVDSNLPQFLVKLYLAPPTQAGDAGRELLHCLNALASLSGSVLDQPLTSTGGGETGVPSVKQQYVIGFLQGMDCFCITGVCSRYHRLPSRSSR